MSWWSSHLVWYSGHARSFLIWTVRWPWMPLDWSGGQCRTPLRVPYTGMTYMVAGYGDHPKPDKWRWVQQYWDQQYSLNLLCFIMLYKIIMGLFLLTLQCIHPSWTLGKHPWGQLDHTYTCKHMNTHQHNVPALSVELGNNGWVYQETRPCNRNHKIKGEQWLRNTTLRRKLYY